MSLPVAAVSSHLPLRESCGRANERRSAASLYVSEVTVRPFPPESRTSLRLSRTVALY